MFGDFLQSPEENVFGILPENKENFYWDFSDEYEVDPETVGQFTGLRDKNGVRVFEGDKISFTRWIGNWQSCDGTHKEITTMHDVVWDNGIARFGLTSPSSDTMKFREHPHYIYEVIGNTHDK